MLEAKDKRYYFSLKNDEEVYGWQDDVYSRSPLMGVSNPTNFVHKVHVGFDPVSGAFTVSFTQFLLFVSYAKRGVSNMGVKLLDDGEVNHLGLRACLSPHERVS